MGIITTGARPIVIAVGIFFDHGGTLRAINPSAIAVGIQCEILFTGRAIPNVFANNDFGRIVSFPEIGTIGAVPITTFAGFGEQMRRRVTRAIPSVIAMRLFGGCVMRSMIGAVPTMRATVRLRICGLTVGAVPTVGTRAIGTDGVVRLTIVAPPVVGAIGFMQQNLPTALVVAEAIATIAGGIDGGFLAGSAVPEVIAVFVGGIRARRRTTRAIPTPVLAICIHGVVRLATRTRPIVIAVAVRL